MAKTAAKNKKYRFGLLLLLYASSTLVIELTHPVPTFYAFIYLMPILFFIPGFAILQLLKGSNRLSISSEIIFSILLSILILMLSGLLINTTLPTVGIQGPLAARPVAISVYFVNILLILLAWKKLQSKPVRVFIDGIAGIPLITRNRKWMVLGPLSSLMVFFGANLLNNGGSNILVFVSLALLVPLIIKSWRANTKLAHSWTIFWIALTLLMMLSLRSNFISGFDISREYQLFNKTLLNNVWQLDQNRDPYSACLSITILPTIITRLTGVAPALVYKMIIQFVFALLPVMVYLLANQFFSRKLALLGSLFFVSQPWFVDPMVTLIRQEIGFVFFAGALLALYDKNINQRLRLLLFVILMLGVILSHYSSAYVTILVFIMLLFANKIINGRFAVRGLNPTTVATLFLLTFLWNAQITSSNKNILIVAQTTFRSIPQMLDITSRSGIVSQVINLGSSDEKKLSLGEEGNYRREAVRDAQPKLVLYPEETYKDLQLSPAPVGKNNPVRKPWFTIASLLYKALLGICMLLMVSGVVVVMYYTVRKHNKILAPYFPLAAVGITLIGAMVILPSISKSYNFDRLYMQMLIFIAPLPFFAASLALSKLPVVKVRAFSLCLLPVILISCYTRGVIWQFAGGKADVWLNNNGTSYTLTYTHAGEHYSALWVRDEAEHGRFVFADSVGRNILTEATNEDVSNHIFPGTFPQMIGRYSYVYFTSAYTKEGLGTYEYRGTQVAYTYPKIFLEINKNVVYSNKISKIYL